MNVISALYVFLLDWAHRSRIDRIDLGGCRPFLNDGVLQFKKKFNIRIVNSSRKKILYLNPVQLTPSVVSFLVNNPVVRSQNGELVGTVFTHDDFESGLRDTVWSVDGKPLRGLSDVEHRELSGSGFVP